MSVLDTLRKSPEWLANRRNSIGGSDAAIIMGANPEIVDGSFVYDPDATPDKADQRRRDRLLKLWRQKRGEQEPDDLSDKLNVMMGLFTEPLNQAWFEYKTGLAVTHTQHSAINGFRSCTLDGMVGSAIWEAKHNSTFFKDELILDAYMPQLHHNMEVCKTRQGYLSVLKGNSDWFMAEVEYDDAYGKLVSDTVAAFWACVQSGEPPCPIEPPAPPRPVAFREIDMSDRNSWAMAAAEWLANKESASRFEASKKDIKGIMPDDCKTAFGHGIKAVRDARGAVRIGEQAWPT